MVWQIRLAEGVSPNLLKTYPQQPLGQIIGINARAFIGHANLKGRVLMRPEVDDKELPTRAGNAA